MGLDCFQILADGQDITAKIRPFFLRLTITDNAGIDSDHFELVLADDGKVAFPQRQSQIEIYTGVDRNALVFRGEYTVNSVTLTSPEKTMTLAGYAGNMGGKFKTHRDFTWSQVTLKALVETVAQRNGLTPAVSASYAAIQIPHYIQAGQSDADLVTELAKEHGATMKIARERLVFFPRGDNQSVSAAPLSPVAVKLTNEVEARLTLSGTGRFQAVEAFWQQVELGYRQSVRVGKDGGKIKKLSKIFPDAEAAKAAAEAVLYHEQRKDYKLSLDELPFIAGIQAERNIQLSGYHRPEFNTEWMCENVTEVISENGHILSCSFVIPKGESVQYLET
ncbi:phage late control D family protein [Vibrio mangrovi]|uniref:Contractile injection system protein, VgrG/Pvc8 family n=1 Tax=Vibrio mangrovi TaxID=474394 RepID=A0A1Y6ITJ6_9VIBR|nr:contractile injection system protein, VgrG/Pvc8 family [Vibrio mangrovi]MDW6004706.1 contractile injection system protein, VgrG/Pvc8 family [Vibrio mangrovi]SMS00997.1 Phage late control gene D protein (GPD) [Vibrio mangrovi]